jgi:MFS family permease
MTKASCAAPAPNNSAGEGSIMKYTRRYENFLVAVLFLTWGTVFLDRMAQLYLAPYLLPDLHMNNAQAGFVASITGLAWAVSTLLFGAVSDRVGRRAVLIPAVFAFSLLSWISGMVQSYEQLLLVRALLGFAEGPCFSVIMAIVEESSEPSRRASNVGLTISAAALVGLALAPVLTTQVAAHFGWRWAFFVAGIPGIILAVLILLFVAEPSRQADNPAALATRRPAGIKEYFSVLQYRNMLLCCLIGASNLTFLFLLGVFAPLYITQVAHQAPTTAGLILGAVGLGSFFTGFILPAVSDRTGRKPMLLINSVTTGLIPLLLLVPSLYEHLWLMAVLMFAFSAGQSMAALALVIIPTETIPRQLAATGIGLATMFAEVIGATVAPAVGGMLAQSYGLPLTLWGASGAKVASFIVTLFLIETARRAAARKPQIVAQT